mmetsp:Transcript_24908/g.40362  ORF Transcript_24908/g.40362 Transcript_24908/m.40362 type:complete len:115 (-) Transcript_24908:24-368(-)
MQPSWMFNELRRRYPNRLRLPSENAIRQEITRLIQRQKAGKALGAPSGMRGRKGMEERFLNWLRERALTHTPGKLLPLFRDQFGSEDDVPTDQQVKSKISNLRSAHKKNNKNTL